MTVTMPVTMPVTMTALYGACSGSNVSEHGDVLVLANGGEEEPAFCAVRGAACARARREGPENANVLALGLTLGRNTAPHVPRA